METIKILAEALAKASKLDILRLDLQYNCKTELYMARLELGIKKDLGLCHTFDIYENGEITKIQI